MRRREAAEPLSVASDGAPGMIRAIEGCLPCTARQRCLAHKVRNLHSKVPKTSGLSPKPAPFGCYQAVSPARQSRIPIRPVLVGYLPHRRSRAQH
jgi:hypothetical protein